MCMSYIWRYSYVEEPPLFLRQHSLPFHSLEPVLGLYSLNLWWSGFATLLFSASCTFWDLSGKVRGKGNSISGVYYFWQPSSSIYGIWTWSAASNIYILFLLRRAFVKMSTTPEAFLSLRSHFASSHALMCISHWILGIGDRHLSNFMVNMETGGMVGIDFGHAFGSATQVFFLPLYICW